MASFAAPPRLGQNNDFGTHVMYRMRLLGPLATYLAGIAIYIYI